MSTRAVYTFYDQAERFSVYKHFDGYPERAIPLINKACEHSRTRFEPGEFAAAFIAANKARGGDIALTIGQERHGDLDYVYEVTSRDRQLYIEAFAVSYGQADGKRRQERKALFSGTLEQAQHWSSRLQR